VSFTAHTVILVMFSPLFINLSFQMFIFLMQSTLFTLNNVVYL